MSVAVVLNIGTKLNEKIMFTQLGIKRREEVFASENLARASMGQRNASMAGIYSCYTWIRFSTVLRLHEKG